MKPKAFSFLKLAMFVSLMALCPATWAQTVVTTANDSGPGSLRDAINNTAAGGTITFSNNLSGATIVLTSGELLLDQNVTIDASALSNGITINGNASSRIFEMDSASSVTTVTLKSLTITNGVAPVNTGEGGGILNQGNLTMYQCTVAGNSTPAYGQGGGIYDGNATLAMYECTLSGNSAMGGGDGGAICCVGGSLTLSNCTVSGNTLTSGEGAGICLSFTTATLDQCTIANNNGGNNGQGGAIYASYGGSLTVNQCTITGNSAGNTYGGGPGGIGFQTTLNLFNSIVAGNTGGDLFNDGGSENATGTNLIGVTPVLSLLGNYGGPTQTMPPLPGSPALDAGSDSATNLFSTDQRGLPRLSGAHVDIGADEAQYETLVVSNTADDGTGSLRVAVTNAVSGFTTITFATSLSGQTIALTSGELLLNKNLTIDGSALAQPVQISGSQASRVFEIAGGSTVTLNALTIAGGSVNNAYGGGIYNAGTLTLNQCVVSSNVANALSFEANVFGGGLYNSGTLTLNQCVVSSNAANGADEFQGGGLFNDSSGTATLTACTLSGNAAQAGGGIYDYGNLSLNQCTLSGNTAVNGGGGIVEGSGTVTLNQSTVSANSSPSSEGGGLYLSSGLFNLNNSILAGNTGGDLLNNGGSENANGPNVISVTPGLSPLGNYGGPTQTMPPLPGSPAIDACTSGTSFATDQRGLPRILGLYADAGAVEGVYNPAGPGTLNRLVHFAAGGWQLSFTNSTDMTFDVLTSTNAALPLSLWTDLGSIVETTPGSGQYQFTDGEPARPSRFYSIRWP